MLPIFFGFAFLSKQVPSFYVIISVILILIIISLAQKKYYRVKYSFLSSILFILSLLIFGKIQGINLSSFLEQYFFYPQIIAAQRIDNFNFTFRGVVDHFKFIYIALIPLFFVNFKKILFEKIIMKIKIFTIF